MKVIENYLLTLNLCEGDNCKHLKDTLIYKAKKFMLTIVFFKSLHILEGSASSVQVGILNTQLFKVH